MTEWLRSTSPPEEALPEEARGEVAGETPADCGDLGLSIDRHGQWFYHDSPIGRKEMVCLFASMLVRHADGSYWLESPGERGTLHVEDAPFLAVEMFTIGIGQDQVVSFRTNVDEMVTLDAAHPLRLAVCPETGDPLPYVYLRDGLEARLSRSVYYELVDRGFEEKVDGEDSYGIWSKGTFFPLGRLTPQE